MDMKMKAHLEFQKMVIKWNYFLQMRFVLMSTAKLQAEKNVCPKQKETQLSQARLSYASPSLCWKPPTASPRAQNYENHAYAKTCAWRPKYRYKVDQSGTNISMYKFA